MAEHHDLGVLRRLASARQEQPAKHPDDGECWSRIGTDRDLASSRSAGPSPTTPRRPRSPQWSATSGSGRSANGPRPGCSPSSSATSRGTTSPSSRGLARGVVVSPASFASGNLVYPYPISCREQAEFIMSVSRISVIAHSTDHDAAVQRYQLLLGIPPAHEFTIPERDLTVTVLPGLSVISGTADALASVRDLRATAFVDSLAETRAHLAPWPGAGRIRITVIR